MNTTTCVTCSRPTDGFIVTVCSMHAVRKRIPVCGQKRIPVCGQKEDSDTWTGIRNMEFNTLYKTTSVLIITMCISTIFQKLDYRDHGYVTLQLRNISPLLRMYVIR